MRLMRESKEQISFHGHRNLTFISVYYVGAPVATRTPKIHVFRHALATFVSEEKKTDLEQYTALQICSFPALRHQRTVLTDACFVFELHSGPFERCAGLPVIGYFTGNVTHFPNSVRGTAGACSLR